MAWGAETKENVLKVPRGGRAAGQGEPTGHTQAECAGWRSGKLSGYSAVTAGVREKISSCDGQLCAGRQGLCTLQYGAVGQATHADGGARKEIC